METIDADVGNMFEKLDSWVDGFFRLLPNIAVGIVVLVVFWFLGKLAASLVRRTATARGRSNLGEVLGKFTALSFAVAGVMLALTIISPSIKPVDLFAGLGIGSVAIGFAFKDILQNMLAGILILIRQPFEVGDQIVSGGHEGTVERIETRATMVKTYDGRRVVIPNSEIYTEAVVVNTAYEIVRSQYDVGIGCNDDIQAATDKILDAIADTDGVKPDPGPDVIPIAIADFSTNLRVRWWTASDRASVITTFGRVIKAIKEALDEDGIDMPYPTQVILLHDQTEDVDGDRRRQREGWPSGKNPPKPARRADGAQRRPDPEPRA